MPTKWSGLEGNKFTKSTQIYRYQAGIHLQDNKIQGQNFAQNSNQKPFYNDLKLNLHIFNLNTINLKLF